MEYISLQGYIRNTPSDREVHAETFKAESETADLWQPKRNKNQIVLAAAVHTLDRGTGPLEDIPAGRWSLGIVEQSQGKGCC